MLNPEQISDALENASDAVLARKRRHHVQAFRGLRGVPHSAISRQLAELWNAGGVDLEDDEDSLRELFITAQEDGLVAIGLVAAAAQDAPEIALDLARDWAEMTDDVETADALGWLVLGPSLLLSDRDFVATLSTWRELPRPQSRRAALMAAMAALPVSIEGPAAAALRERMGQRRISFVAEPRADLVDPVCQAALRDDNPHVRKALIRVLRTWGSVDPEPVQAFLDRQRGGVPRALRDPVTRGIRKGLRGQHPK